MENKKKRSPLGYVGLYVIGAIVGAAVSTVCFITYVLAAIVGGVVGGLTWDYDDIIGLITGFLL